jgi:hypothetical protein
LIRLVPGTDLAGIVENLSEKYNKQVVVLIDEYNVPVSENLGSPTVAENNREILKEFYSALKKADECLRFVFVTGVTVAPLWLPARLSQLNDLTLDENYAGICGFTCDEMENCLREHLPIVLKRMKTKGLMTEASVAPDLLELIIHRCDGYSWTAGLWS